MRMKVARRAAKVSTNLSVRSDLVQRAKALKINLSELLETTLEADIRNAEREAWLSENQPAIRAYNDRIEKRGVFSDRWRRF
jgi:antitoxin CcdA